MNERALRILVANPRPPETYLKALDSVSMSYDCSLLPADLSIYDGLLLTGGGDVLPAYYEGDTPSSDVNFVKDKLEFDLLRYFTEKQLPVLAICRGFQLVNVFFGGTLKCVSGHMRNDDNRHSVSSRENPFGIFSEVNSSHNQAVDSVPENAEIIAVAPDLTIEAAIYSENVFCFQFHPERMPVGITERVFGVFADCVKKRLTASS